MFSDNWLLMISGVEWMNTLINCISKDIKKSVSITLKAMPKAYTKTNKNTIENFLGRSDQYSVAIRWQWSFFKFRIPHSTGFLPQEEDVHKIQKYLNAWFLSLFFTLKPQRHPKIFCSDWLITKTWYTCSKRIRTVIGYLCNTIFCNCMHLHAKNI